MRWLHRAIAARRSGSNTNHDRDLSTSHGYSIAAGSRYSAPGRVGKRIRGIEDPEFLSAESCPTYVCVSALVERGRFVDSRLLDLIRALRTIRDAANWRRRLTSLFFRRSREGRDPPKTAAFRRCYERPPSFTDLLPWTTYLPDRKFFVLDDGISIGCALELFPIGTEAVSEEFLVDVRNALQVALVDAIPEDTRHPWVLQLFLQDDYDLTPLRNFISTYGTAEARGTSYAGEFKDLFDAHLQRLSRPEGVFVDKAVTDAPWRGKIRRVRVTLYQRVSGSSFSLPDDQERQLEEVLSRFQTALDVADVAHVQLDLTQFREWMIPWFNPKPSITNSNVRSLLDIAAESPNPIPSHYDVSHRSSSLATAF